MSLLPTPTYDFAEELERTRKLDWHERPSLQALRKKKQALKVVMENLDLQIQPFVTEVEEMTLSIHVAL